MQSSPLGEGVSLTHSGIIRQPEPTADLTPSAVQDNSDILGACLCKLSKAPVGAQVTQGTLRPHAHALMLSCALFSAGAAWLQRWNHTQGSHASGALLTKGNPVRVLGQFSKDLTILRKTWQLGSRVV